jgi:hypothetical protein
MSVNGSVFGVTAYTLMTTKGRTFVPLVRGTGFCVGFSNTSFYTRHVVTAGHVARPQRYGKLYGNAPELSQIKDRHVSTKLHLFTPAGQRFALLPLEFNVHSPPRVNVAILRIEREGPILSDMSSKGLPAIEPFELDTEGLARGEDVRVMGLHMTSVDTLADAVNMVPEQAMGTLQAKYVSDDLGTVLLANLKSGSITPGMHGAPVLRASNNKVVGVLVGGTQRHTREYEKAPNELGVKRGFADKEPRAPEVTDELNRWREKNMHAPAVDISTNAELLDAVPDGGFAFVPLGEFYSFLRRTEI